MRRRMVQLGIDPNQPEYGLARRILNNWELKKFLLSTSPEHRQLAYDKLKPLLQFPVQDFEILTAPDA